MTMIRRNCEFKRLLDSCYFHKSRRYPCESVKTFSRCAMVALWRAKDIVVAGHRFTQDKSRDLIIDEMMPDDLDRAIAYAERLNWQIEFDRFAILIFLCVLFSDAIVQTEFEEIYGQRSS